MLTIEQIEATAGPASEWHGRCAEIAAHAAKLLDGAENVYGHWCGPVHPYGYWGARRGHGFIQHGWVLLPDGRVLDPTRFSFENEEPYVYCGADDEGYYDRGGSRLRESMHREKPFPMQHVTDESKRIAPLDVRTRRHMEQLAGYTLASKPEDADAVWLVFTQIMWFANAPLSVLGEHAKPIFEALIASGQAGTIPIDNRQEVLS